MNHPSPFQILPFRGAPWGVLYSSCVFDPSVRLTKFGTLFQHFSDDTVYVGRVQDDLSETGAFIRDSTWTPPWGGMMIP